MLSVRGLKAGYDGSEILHSVDIEVGDCNIVALIGPNGSGKSTLLKSIFNLVDVYSGSIIFGQYDLSKLPTHFLIRAGLAFVPQDDLTFPTMTVVENLEVAGYSPKEHKPIEEIYKLFPMLADKKHSFARNLSGGQQRVLGIARALVQKPRLLLLDEPSAGLAPKVAAEIFELIRQIRDNGTSVLIAEQNAKQAVAVADNTYVLEAGTVKLEGSGDLLAGNELKKVFLGSS